MKARANAHRHWGEGRSLRVGHVVAKNGTIEAEGGGGCMVGCGDISSMTEQERKRDGKKI